MMRSRLETSLRTLLRQWHWFVLAGFLSGAAAGDVSARLAPEVLAEYRQLPGSKALAAFTGVPESALSVVHSQTEDSTAALLALRGCEQNRAPASPPCEVLWLNDERITTGAEILSSRPPEPHPLYLWQYQQGATRVYLAGSIHVLKATLHPLNPAFEAAFQAADHLVLEVNTQALPPQEIQLKTMRYGVLPDGMTLSHLLPPDLNARLTESLARYGMAPAMVQKLKPALLMTQLVVARMMALGYLPNYGLEQHFVSRAAGKEILELESLDAQLELLLNQPLDTQIALLGDTLDQEADIEPMMTAMLSAWLGGDDAEFMRLFELQQGDSEAADAFMKQLLDDRNEAMAQGIAGLLQRPGTYFVLVGAAHYIGEQGIIEQLRRRGITGRRFLSNQQLEDL